MEESDFYSTPDDVPSNASESHSNYEEIVAVSVDSYKFEDGTLKKHVIYVIQGQDSTGLFVVSRRYKEFQSLRTILSMQWPAIYIPKLPKKKAVGNLKIDLIHKRKKLLDYFMGKLVSFNFFYKSEPFQMFIRGPQDFIKSSSAIKQGSYLEICERFKSNFNDYENFENSPQVQEKIQENLNVLKESLTKVKDFKKFCKSNVLSFYRYEDSLIKLSNGLKDVTHYFYPTKENVIELNKKSNNPYKVLLDWARKETLEIESLIEALEKKNYLDTVLTKTSAKLEKQQHGLENFQQGKKSFFQKLTKKSDEQKVKELESEVNEGEKELQALNEVIRIATARLVNYQLPFFQEKEVEKLESTIRCYSGLVVEEYNDFINHFSNIRENIIPSVI